MKKWLCIVFLLFFSGAILYSQTLSTVSHTFALDNWSPTIPPLPDPDPSTVGQAGVAVSPRFELPLPGLKLEVKDWNRHENETMGHSSSEK